MPSGGAFAMTTSASVTSVAEHRALSRLNRDAVTASAYYTRMIRLFFALLLSSTFALRALPTDFGTTL